MRYSLFVIAAIVGFNLTGGTDLKGYKSSRSRVVSSSVQKITYSIHKTSSSAIIGNGRMPMLASDRQGIIHLVYGIGDSLLHRYSSDKGRSFRQPELIAIVSGLNAAATRGPQIAVTRNGLSVIASTGAGSIYSFTHDTGGKWTKGGQLTDADSVALEGFVSLASDGGSSVFAVWLDLRDDRRNKVFGARSTDGGKTWSENSMVYKSPDSSVCECCKLTAVMSGSNVYVMFRNWLNGNRDLYLIKSPDRGRFFGEAEKLGLESWALNGCPMDGGSLAVNKNGIPQTVWNRKGTIYSCVPGKPEMPIGQGRSCTIETLNGQNVYAWIENGQVVVLNPKGVKTILGKGQLPVLKAAGNEQVLCVWENEKRLYSALISL